MNKYRKSEQSPTQVIHKYIRWHTGPPRISSRMKSDPKADRNEVRGVGRVEGEQRRDG
jgi:hypothetical protein